MLITAIEGLPLNHTTTEAAAKPIIKSEAQIFGGGSQNNVPYGYGEYLPMDGGSSSNQRTGYVGNILSSIFQVFDRASPQQVYCLQCASICVLDSHRYADGR